MLDDLIRRSKAIEAIKEWGLIDGLSEGQAVEILEDEEKVPSAQSERILYANMSDTEFEKWLYENGICNPNIHESIPCDVVPLLIDNAISELPSAQSEQTKMIKEIRKWINSGNRGSADYFIVDMIEEIIDKYE